MIFIDTNILIRYLGGDGPQKRNRCSRLLQAAKSGSSADLYLTHLMLAEAIWILSKKYGISKHALVESLRRLLNTPHIFCDDAPLILAALDLFESKSISFIDAYHATFLPAKGITEIYSYDADFDQIAGITRREP